MKFLKKILPFVVIVGATVLLLYLPDRGPEKYTDLATYFKTERGRQAYVGYAVAAVADGSILYLDAFGADGSGKALSIDTPFCVGAVSESFTGLATLSLARDRKVSIDRPIVEYLPDFGFAPGSAYGDGKSVTIRHLLSHTSGISDRDFDDEHPEAKDLEGAVQALKSARPRALPGREEHYIDSGYQAVGLALEKASGESFAELMDQRVFKPLGMTKSSAGANKVEAALPMGSGSFFGAVLPRRQELFASGAPSSYIVSTPEDMAKYLSFLAGPEKLKRPPLSPRAVRSLFEPLEGISGYSYGWRIEGKGKELSAAHSGSLEAFSASAALWPARRSGIIILAPQNSLLQSLVAMPALVEGARRIMQEGSAPRLFPLGRLYILLAVIAIVHILALALQTGGALSWAKDVKGKADAAGGRAPVVFAIVRSCFGVAVRIALAVAAPIALSALFGRRVTWTVAFALEPGIAAWAVAVLAFGSLRNVARLAWLKGPR
jgi:CubicO group peptidase (beta-lactamase class C family)